MLAPSTTLYKQQPSAEPPRTLSELHQRGVDAGLGQFSAETALVVFRHRRPLHLVAFVEEGQPETKGEIVEDLRVLGPSNHGARRHHGRDIAVYEAGTGQIGERHHRADPAPPFL